jgi:NAD(P)H-nitrite reductase large subunit
MSVTRIPALDGSTIVCRCEETSAADVRLAMTEGATSINDIKRRTRAGMGICQGIFCMRTLAAMLQHEAGLDPVTVLPMTTRPPARVVSLSALANMEE